MKFEIRYKRNKHQEEFHSDTTTKILHLSGGYGSGKTFSLIMKAFQLLWLNKGFAGGLVVPSIADFKKDVQPLMEEICQARGIKYFYKPSYQYYQFPWSRGKLYVVSAQQPIKGPNWAFACINEVTLIDHARFKDVLGRVRIKRAQYPQIAMSGTPEGTNNWVYETLVSNPLPNSRVIYGSIQNNQENLAADFIPTMMNSYDTAMQDAYVRGLFVNMQGSRFYYSYDPAKHHNTTIQQIPGADVHVSLDYNVEPMCATLWHLVTIRDVNGYPVYDLNRQPLRKLVGFGQIEIGNNAGTHKMCDALYARGFHPDTTHIYPDPAGNVRSTKGPPDNEILKQRGFKNIHVRLKAPEFRKRQLATNNLMDKGQVEFNPVECPGIKRDFESVEQDKADFSKLKDNPKLTHYSDGFDYMIDILFPLSGSKPMTGSTKVR